MNDVSEILSRLDNLEQIEAIRRLQYAYCRYLDAEGGFDVAGVVSLWAEDGVWDGGEYGKYVGKAAIAEYFKNHALEVAFGVHFTTNTEVRITGNTATCRCLGLVPASFHAGSDKQNHLLIFCVWDNTFVKSKGTWLFQNLKATVKDAWPYVKVGDTAS
jgi:ketosteroid isomerase-like protein